MDPMGRGGGPGAIGGLAMVVALAFAAAPEAVEAQGFGIHEQSACATARAGASAAGDCGDGSSVFFNPAAVTTHRDLIMSAGLTGIFPSGSFAPDGGGSGADLTAETIPVPHLYVTFPVGDRFSGGVGIYAPFGLETRWPLGFDGRFVGYRNKLQTLYAQPTVAVRITDRVAVGAGPVLILSSLDLNRRLDLASQPVPSSFGTPPGSTFGDLGVPPRTDFADLTLDADEAVATTANFGLLVEPHERVSVGVRYLAGTDIDYEGFAAFEPAETGLRLPAGNPLGLPAGTSVDSLLAASGLFLSGGPLSGQEFTAAVPVPPQLLVGAQVQALDRLQVLLDYQRTGWSDVDVVELGFTAEVTPDDELFLGYEDTHTLRLGADYRVLDELSVRAGYIYSTAASPSETVTPLLPEAARNHVTAGLGWSAGERLTLDVAYQFLSQEDRRGRLVPPAPGEPPTPSLNSGVFTFDAQHLAATLSYRFQ